MHSWELIQNLESEAADIEILLFLVLRYWIESSAIPGRPNRKHNKKSLFYFIAKLTESCKSKSTILLTSPFQADNLERVPPEPLAHCAVMAMLLVIWPYPFFPWFPRITPIYHSICETHFSSLTANHQSVIFLSRSHPMAADSLHFIYLADSARSYVEQ